MAGEKHPRSSYVLGIDIGTTTVKVCLADISTKKPIQTLLRETKSSLTSDQSHLGNEQDVHKICTALQFCLSRLSKDSLQRVVNIGISGQMHGVVLWKQSEGWKQNQFGRYETTDKVSNLFTWQDGRCSAEFLAELPKPHSHLRLSTGHGCATLFWLKEHLPNFLSQYDVAGTIQDFVVAMICGLDAPIMSVQNAAGWGYFDTVTKKWNTDRLSTSDFPIHLLPEVVDPGETIGLLQSSWYGIPEGTPVGVALGDMQCSVFSTLETDTDAVLNLSTSAQLSFIMPDGFTPSLNSAPTAIEYFPYFNGRYLAVAASLNGGNVMAVFVRMLQQWTHELGLGVPEDKIWEKILALSQDDSIAESDLDIVPTLFGERHLPDHRASVNNVDPQNISLGKVGRSLCRGIVKNISNMMSGQKLVEAGIKRIVGTGSALNRNQTLKKEVECQYSLPVIYPGAGNDAAVGVALIAIKQL
ncbi:hypothetical protein CHUAL_000367 [Chamberlinius hualienensis]